MKTKLEDFFDDDLVNRIKEYEKDNSYIDFETTVRSLLDTALGERYY